jgi:hypothetical protein
MKRALLLASLGFLLMTPVAFAQEGTQQAPPRSLQDRAATNTGAQNPGTPRHYSRLHSRQHVRRHNYRRHIMRHRRRLHRM